MNAKLAVYSKSGTALIGPEATNTLWSGAGGGCENNNDGDATVLFDTLNQRWVIQQFSVSTTPYWDCVAVSETSDATGKWHRYGFQYGYFPDYPKMGVWSDAYYVSFNMLEVEAEPERERYVGAEVCALNRAKMLAGEATGQKCFLKEGGAFSLLPATLDGTTPPPSGEPEWFVSLSPTAYNALAYWKFHVDWSNPANSTFTGPTNLAVEPFSEACGGEACIPQAGTSQRLDSLGDRLMYRLAYRNFGDHEAMVVSHAVTAGSSVGMRWYELRPSGGSLGVYQQGTYAPDDAYRWMGSIAMDNAGDMALGYSVSSGSLHPQISYTGRLVSDPLGTMPQGEATLYAGTASQTGYFGWGDYTEMSVDPSNDCTFWYVNEYHSTAGEGNWRTRIGSFKFPGCGIPTVTTGEATAIQETQGTLNGTVNPNRSETSYHFEYGTTTEYGRAAPIPDGNAGSGSEPFPVSMSVSGLLPGTVYHYRLVATNVVGTTYGSDQTFTTIGYRYMRGLSSGSTVSSWDTMSSQSSPPDSVIADINGDGKADIVNLEYEGGATYRYRVGFSSGTSISSWSTVLSGMSLPERMAVGDVNGDGKADIVSVESEGNGKYRYMLGLSSGTGISSWSTVLSGMSLPTKMATGDVNGDGKADIVSVESEGNGKYRYMLGISSGTSISSWSTVLSGMSLPERMAVGDVNGDGKADIVSVESEGNGKYRYMLGISSGTSISSWSKVLEGMSLPTKMAVGDFTGDGKADIVSVESEGNGKYRYMLGISSGTGISSWSQVLSGMSYQEFLDIGDVNGDGKADIVSVESEGNGKYRFMFGISGGMGVSGWSAAMNGLSGPYFFNVGDIDGDGKADIVSVEKI